MRVSLPPPLPQLQFILFGALASQLNMVVDVTCVNTRILDNSLIAAAAFAVGGSGSATLSTTGCEILGNTVSAAGALAIGDTATVRATGTGGGARNNQLAVAGFVASGGTASASADLSMVPGEDNQLIGAGFTFTQQPVVQSVLKTVMDAVFVSPDSLESSLAIVQQQARGRLGGAVCWARERCACSAAVGAWLTLALTASSSSSSAAAALLRHGRRRQHRHVGLRRRLGGHC